VAASPDALDAAARRLRTEASGLDDLVAGVIDPIRNELPEVWIGPAADLFAEELSDHRFAIAVTAGDLRHEAWLLEAEAQAAREAAAAAAAEAAEAAAAAAAAETGSGAGSGGGGGGNTFF